MNTSKNLLDNYLDVLYIHRSKWLRAAVLGTNDGILSTSSIAIGVAAASDTRDPIVLAPFVIDFDINNVKGGIRRKYLSSKGLKKIISNIVEAL